MLRFLIFQVMQIVLGVLSGVLGGFLYIFSSTTLRNLGAPIWTGAVVSGAGGQREEWTRGEREAATIDPAKCRLLAPEHNPRSSRPMPCFY